jgi:hypothetical protein
MLEAGYPSLEEIMEIKNFWKFDNKCPCLMRYSGTAIAYRAGPGRAGPGQRPSAGAMINTSSRKHTNDLRAQPFEG